MNKYVYEILDEIKKCRSKSKKVEILRNNKSRALEDVIRGSMDSNIVWRVPNDKNPPYTPNKPESVPSNLLSRYKDFGYFVKGSRWSDQLTQPKREKMYLSVLESVHPEDAKLVINMVCKEKIPGLTKPIVQEAFPGLLTD